MRINRVLLATGMAGVVAAGTGQVACSSSNSSGSNSDGGSSSGGSSSGASSSGSSGGSSSGGGEDAGTDSGVGTGPGSALLCPSSGKNAWQTYGATGFVAVNQAIFANVTSQVATDAGATGLGPTFGEIGNGSIPALDDGLATFEGKLAAFLVFAYGGPTSITYTDGKTYSGVQDMVAAHTGLNITPAQYGYFVTNVVVPALSSSGVTSADISGCFAPLVLSTTFMQEIVGNGASAGAALKCTSSGKNAFETYGATAFVAVNEAIFTQVGVQEATDAGALALGPSLPAAGTGMLDDASVPALSDGLATFKGKLAAFLVWGLGGPPQITYTDGKTYSGIQGLTPEHTGLGITSAQYNYFVTNVVIPALTTNGVSSSDVSSCFAPVVTDPNFVAQVVGQ
jgi:hypothetical protein